MKYNFDEVISRKGSASVKHDLLVPNFGSDDLLPMWVADMDFRAPDCVLDAIRKRCDQGFLGYTFGDDSYFGAVIDWLAKHYSVDAKKNELHYIPGIVVGIAFCIQAFTKPGDKILITTPVYPPFVNLPINNGRELVTSKLQLTERRCAEQLPERSRRAVEASRSGEDAKLRFEIDFSDFEQKVKGCKMMLLSNPHNPGGTVWSKADLQRIAEICKRNNVLVISDEIHADLTLPGYHHTSFSTVSDDAKSNCITFIAPSKTFNIAGLSSSIAYIPEKSIRDTYFDYLEASEYANGNIFAYIGAEAAFRGGEEWLSQLKDYLVENIAFADEYFKKNLPAVKAILPEASYLLWLDFNGLGLSHSELQDILINKAKVALNSGLAFGGDDFAGFFRMNIGCPRSILKEALERICGALR